MSLPSRRVVLFANGERGLTIAQQLGEAGVKVVCFVGHGSSVHLSQIERLLTPGTPIVHMAGNSTADWDSVSALLLPLQVDVGVVAGFSFFLPKAILEIPKCGFLNLHAGAVPKYRGGSPLNWQLINGESQAGISILRMTSGIDDGPVVAMGRVTILPDTTIDLLHRQANEMFSKLLLQVLLTLDESLKGAVDQDVSEACYWHQRSDLDGRFDPATISTSALDCLVRGITRPYPGAWAKTSTDILRIFAVRKSEVAYRGTPGHIVKMRGDAPVMILRDGCLRLQDYELSSGLRELRNGTKLQ